MSKCRPTLQMEIEIQRKNLFMYLVLTTVTVCDLLYNVSCQSPIENYSYDVLMEPNEWNCEDTTHRACS